jgi:dihydrofolate reductase
MRKLVLFMHVSLDGFVAGPDGEMDWIHVDEEMFDYAGHQTDNADTALYGRVTWQMMESYWPTAADQPTASRHDIAHSQWYNQVEKIVLSKTLAGKKLKNTTVIGEDISAEIRRIKQNAGKNILIFGSPSASHTLMKENLIDDYWLFINPVVIGNGIPLFDGLKKSINLKLVESNVFSSGVVGLHYEIQPDNK